MTERLGNEEDTLVIHVVYVEYVDRKGHREVGAIVPGVMHIHTSPPTMKNAVWVVRIQVGLDRRKAVISFDEPPKKSSAVRYVLLSKEEQDEFMTFFEESRRAQSINRVV